MTTRVGRQPMAWNPFLDRRTASGYATARPDYRPESVAVIARLLQLDRPVDVAADIGCGTGMSTRAVRAIAHRVVGLDVSRPMLDAADRTPGVSYVQAAAERLPLRSGGCDLVTAAAAFHWFDQTLTLAEVRRVLRPGGGLAVYTEYFTGRLRDRPAFADWLTGVYLHRYPTPGRRPRFDPVAVEWAGLRMVGDETLARPVALTAAQLTDYLLTQRTATSAIDSGRSSRSAMRSWLFKEISAILPEGATGIAEFTGHVWCCRLRSTTGPFPASSLT